MGELDSRHAKATYIQEHLPRALAAEPRQETDEELVAGEGAVGHVVEGDGVGQLAGAVQIQPIG